MAGYRHLGLVPDIELDFCLLTPKLETTYTHSWVNGLKKYDRPIQRKEWTIATHDMVKLKIVTPGERNQTSPRESLLL